MSGAEITTRHMLFPLIVSLLSATGHDFSFRSAQLSYMPSSAVSDFRLLCFVNPNSLSVKAILRIIFFEGLTHWISTMLSASPSSIGVISHKNLAPAVLEYARPEA